MFIPTREKVRKVLEEKGYAFFTNGAYNLNLIGIRKSQEATNRFVDTFMVIYKTPDGQWHSLSFPCTTAPGWYYLKHGLEKGTAVMKPGQYRGAYQRGTHNGKVSQYTALVQRKPITVYRDRNKDYYYDYEHPETGLFGVNIHRATKWGVSEIVDKNSAGCQVLASANDFATLMHLVDMQIQQGLGNSFTYTLLEEKDFK